MTAAAECPKCGTERRPQDAACRTCGLATERMGSWSRDQDANVPVDVRAAWEAVVGRWDDEARHDAMLQLATSANAFAWLAKQYRAAQKTRPGDPTAARQLEKLRRTTEIALQSTRRGPRTDGKPMPYRATIGVLALVLVLGLVGGLFFLYLRLTGVDVGRVAPVEQTR